MEDVVEKFAMKLAELSGGLRMHFITEEDKHGDRVAFECHSDDDERGAFRAASVLKPGVQMVILRDGRETWYGKDGEGSWVKALYAPTDAHAKLAAG